MGQNINRQPHNEVATISATGTTSSIIHFGQVVMGVLQPRTAPVSASFQLHGSATATGTYSPIKDDNNAELAAIDWDTTKHISIPVEAAKYAYLKIVTNIAETGGLVIDVVSKA